MDSVVFAAWPFKVLGACLKVFRGPAELWERTGQRTRDVTVLKSWRCYVVGTLSVLLACGEGPGGYSYSSSRVHHGRVGSAGLCDLKILHPWRRLKKGVKILQWLPPPPPPTLEKRGQYSTSVWKVCKKRGSKIYNSKKYRGQNSTSLKMGVKILHAE